jgi:hypothetical protein
MVEVNEGWQHQDLIPCDDDGAIWGCWLVGSKVMASLDKH